MHRATELSPKENTNDYYGSTELQRIPHRDGQTTSIPSHSLGDNAVWKAAKQQCLVRPADASQHVTGF